MRFFRHGTHICIRTGYKVTKYQPIQKRQTSESRGATTRSVKDRISWLAGSDPLLGRILRARDKRMRQDQSPALWLGKQTHRRIFAQRFSTGWCWLDLRAYLGGALFRRAFSNREIRKRGWHAAAASGGAPRTGWFPLWC